jgi:hypothetical protein
MAFQTGSQVRPELGRADVSGFARGGEYLAAGIGAGIKSLIKGKQEKDKLNATSDVLTGMIKDNEYAQVLFGISPNEAGEITRDMVKPFVKSIGVDESMAMATQLNLALIKSTLDDDDDKVGAKSVSALRSLATELDLDITSEGTVREKGRFGGGKVLQEDDPRVQSLLDIEGGKQAIFGYDVLKQLQ